VARGRLSVVATPIGNLEDMSHRAVRILGEAEVIAAEDTRAAGVLLDRYGIRGARVVSFFEGNEAQRTAELRALLERGARVALISEAGMPGISDPGQRLVSAATASAAGVAVEVIPGPTAAIAALVLSGLPSARFLFLGFPPREAGARAELFGSLRADPSTLILYEAPGRVGATLADLAAAFGQARPAVLCRELTKLHEEAVRGTLAELRARFADTAPRGECTLVVEGASEGIEEIDVEAEVRRLLAEGLGPRDVAARVAARTGKARRLLYQLALSLQRDGGGA
jgi:16S rRNA (cytidine1402-2'-O)-methyltransferase